MHWSQWAEIFTRSCSSPCSARNATSTPAGCSASRTRRTIDSAIRYPWRDCLGCPLSRGHEPPGNTAPGRPEVGPRPGEPRDGASNHLTPPAARSAPLLSAAPSGRRRGARETPAPLSRGRAADAYGRGAGGEVFETAEPRRLAPGIVKPCEPPQQSWGTAWPTVRTRTTRASACASGLNRLDAMAGGDRRSVTVSESDSAESESASPRATCRVAPPACDPRTAQCPLRASP